MHPPSSVGLASPLQARLGLSGVDKLVQDLFDQRISTATRSVYDSGWRRYLQFCNECNIAPLPVNQDSQAAFAAYLSQSVSPRTIRSYLCAIRFYRIRARLPDPTCSLSARLQYMLKGIQRSSPTSQNPKRRPITPDLLTKIHTLWSNDSQNFDKVMLWAAFCLGFFGFMRSGEFTSSSLDNPNNCPLTTAEADIAVDSRINPQVLSIFLRSSKMDPFGPGTHLYLGRTGTLLCPVSALLAYFAIRPPHRGPLFIFKNGTPLSREHLVTHLRKALSQLGIDVTYFSGHSFGIGAATTAARTGFGDSFIQTLGRWKS